MNLYLDSECKADCTVGTLTCASLTLKTIELPWDGNAPDKSCVPAGEYQLVPYISPKHGQTWRLHAPSLGVWGSAAPAPVGMRTEVEIHSGNFACDSLGCLIVGMGAGEMLSPKSHIVEPAVLDSRIAIDELRELLDGTSEEDLLTISRGGLYAPA